MKRGEVTVSIANYLKRVYSVGTLHKPMMHVIYKGIGLRFIISIGGVMETSRGEKYDWLQTMQIDLKVQKIVYQPVTYTEISV
ncbi:hypothetical protein AKO1_010948 [Acrasis kona]|uniref:Uncharacterized protein n=1 Tax=Acrasis kona TaxID=1008807 RepID=A0AAW2YSY2_9EUKA